MERVGRYEVWGTLGSGGTARVDIARMQGEAEFVRLVALKRLHAKVDADADAVVRFHDEAMLAARIHHPNVVRVLDVLRDGDSLAVAYEFVLGLSLRDVIAKVGAEGIPTPFAARIAVDVLEGLHAAHTAVDEAGTPLHVVHRDVSPSNVLVDVNGTAKVIDFGLATATRRIARTKPGDVHGTIPYMAPERLRGESGDVRGDVYAVAVVLWEMLSGRRLFQGQEGEIVWRILEGTIPPAGAGRSDVPAEFAAIVMQALAREPERRFASAREFGQAIERAAPPAPNVAFAKWVAYRWKTELEALRERANAALRGDRTGFDAGRAFVSAPPDPRTMTLPSLNGPDDDDVDGTEVSPSPFANPSRTLLGEHGAVPYVDDTWRESVAPLAPPVAAPSAVPSAPAAPVASPSTAPIIGPIIGPIIAPIVGPGVAPVAAPPAPTLLSASGGDVPAPPAAPNAPIPWPENWPMPPSTPMHAALSRRNLVLIGILAVVVAILAASLVVTKLRSRAPTDDAASPTADTDAATAIAPPPTFAPTSDVEAADAAVDAASPDAATARPSRSGRGNEHRRSSPRKSVKR